MLTPAEGGAEELVVAGRTGNFSWRVLKSGIGLALNVDVGLMVDAAVGVVVAAVPRLVELLDEEPEYAVNVLLGRGNLAWPCLTPLPATLGLEPLTVAFFNPS